MPPAAVMTTSGFENGLETNGFENNGFGAPEFVESHTTQTKTEIQSAHRGSQHTPTKSINSVNANDSSTPITTGGFDNFGVDAFGRYVRRI